MMHVTIVAMLNFFKKISLILVHDVILRTICFSDVKHYSELLVTPKYKNLNFRLYRSDVK